MCIRQAGIEDHEAICAIDSVAATSVKRRNQIRNWLETAHCCVVEVNGRVAGYGVLTQYFHGHPFIELIMVDPSFVVRGWARRSSDTSGRHSLNRNCSALPTCPTSRCRTCLRSWGSGRAGTSKISMKVIRKSFSIAPPFRSLVFPVALMSNFQGCATANDGCPDFPASPFRDIAANRACHCVCRPIRRSTSSSQ